MGCSLEVEEDANSQNSLSVTGNRCPRGAIYAKEEIRSPKRVVTATCSIEGEADFANSIVSVRRVPVKTSSPCPREKIQALLQDIYKTTVSLPVKAGDIVLADWKGEKIDVVATRTIS
jgi:CxxC motif-containing protein